MLDVLGSGESVIRSAFREGKMWAEAVGKVWNGEDVIHMCVGKTRVKKR